MTEEEKKAIERIEDTFYQDLGKGINKFQKITLYEDRIADIRKLLNLVERQQKDCISKDKIREKINQLKEIADEDNPDIYIKIDAYVELLEEN